MNDLSYPMDWAYAWGGPAGKALFKEQPEDFIVEEQLPFEPDGEGEHLLVYVEKQGENTDWVAGRLARFAKVKRLSVSYAGRKDRHGVTRQWFSVWMPGMEEPRWSDFQEDNIRILQVSRHRRKLKTGALKGNRFIITLRNVDADREQLETLLDNVAVKGVPSYFGEQRFGRRGENLERAIKMFAGEFRAHKNKRAMYLSAARSWLFNRIVSERVNQNNWLNYITGDVPGFQDSGSLILRDHNDELMARIHRGEVVLTAPLWGEGELLSDSECKALEVAALEPYAVLKSGLEDARMKQERRAIRLIPGQMQWEWQDDLTLQLSFMLPKGCFATSVLRELLLCEERDRFEPAAVQ
ncbi:tRNA pseudouridine(13) synthase TruD [Endozoicomonas euniceicola]|uniref:tRNA pseudouridine synthase D n=1 Tax=Endozoicomonas euniceicola TaxID=1234143 RepID=A0ABY6GVP9_9GAMM|nr:tRNA pseudouridine(13) synthase TruD [Endozoicomonas euniceicola]UYM16123.1 tRNA pseudouridine(13) synthase TruD [Endozoicomonas euniceicola]